MLTTSREENEEKRQENTRQKTEPNPQQQSRGRHDTDKRIKSTYQSIRDAEIVAMPQSTRGAS